LSEAKNRFKIKNGDVEIEYEGPIEEVNERYDNALKWLASQTLAIPKKKESAEGEKEEKRGGVRKPIYPQWIEKLKIEKFFRPKKSLDEIIKKFESLGVPTRDKRTAIRNALINDTHKKESKLKSTKEGDEWFFWED
jgi:predicted metal-dependent hydrolase